ncbi:MAG: nitroreductase family protein [Balneolaceae bacterium]
MSDSQTIRSRQTIKLKVDENNPLPVNTSENFRKEVEKLIEIAGWAPFHYECNSYYQEGDLNGKEPWRFHVLDSQTCRDLLEMLKKDIPVKSTEGIKQMLAAADALILVNWLPEPSSRTQKFYPNVKNMEHIAATGAAIQNLLLMATEKGIINYWSSGGILRKPAVQKLLGISLDEILLGAVFLFPDPDDVEAEVITGKNREMRSTSEKWMEWVSVKGKS